MYSKYIMSELAIVLSDVDKIIAKCTLEKGYESITDKVKFKKYVEAEYKSNNGTVDPAKLINEFLQKLDGGRRRTKQSKKRATRHRRRSSKRKARKARTTRRKY